MRRDVIASNINVVNKLSHNWMSLHLRSAHTWHIQNGSAEMEFVRKRITYKALYINYKANSFPTVLCAPSISENFPTRKFITCREKQTSFDLKRKLNLIKLAATKKERATYTISRKKLKCEREAASLAGNVFALFSSLPSLYRFLKYDVFSAQWTPCTMANSFPTLPVRKCVTITVQNRHIFMCAERWHVPSNTADNEKISIE